MTRAFVAIRPPAAVLDAIEGRVSGVSMAGGRPAPREQWHLTVQFLGDAVDVDAVAAVFAEKPLDAGAGEIRLGGADTFGNRRRARILALFLHDGEEWVRALAAQVEGRVAPLGHMRDAAEKDYVPHLTLARFREATDLRPLCAAVGSEPVGPAWPVGEVVLYESVLGPRGARHVARARVATVASLP